MVAKVARSLVVFVAALFILGVAAGLAEASPGARALEARLYAPCCYGGTLDIHESDLARSLREEIEQRLSNGENTEAIQGDLVVRYGEKVLAAKSDAPFRSLGLLAALAACLTGWAIIAALRRWTRRATGLRDGIRKPLPSSSATARDDLDARLDAELASLDS